MVGALIGAEALRVATARLRESGLDSPRREARLLVEALLPPGSPGLSSQAGSDAPIDGDRFAAALARRAAREPLAFITGARGFWSLDLAVSPATLIPRPDSETLIEAALAAFPDRRRVRRILDLGTGTGALLLAALSEFGDAFGVGVDLSATAAGLAAGNARRAGLDGRCAFLAGDWAASLAAAFELILCNPPYIRHGDLAALMPEVREYEPASALDGGPDGLAAYRALLPGLAPRLGPGGVAVLELGQGQSEPVAGLAEAAGLRVVGRRPDLAGIDRALVLARQAG